MVSFWNTSTFDDESSVPLHALYTDSFTFCAAHWPDEASMAAEWRSVVATPNSHQSFVSLHDLRLSPQSQLLAVLRPDGKPGMTMAVRLCTRDALPYAFAVYEDGCLRMWDLRNAREPIAIAAAPVAVDDDELPISEELQSANKIEVKSSLQVYSKTDPATCFDIDANRAFIGGSTTALQTVDIDFAQARLSRASTLELKKAGLGAVCVRRDGRLLATGGWDAKVRIFTAKRLRPLAIVREHVGSVFALDFGFAPEHLLASGGKDGHVVVHNIFSGGSADNDNT
jgi:WD40 repeat protein